MKFQDNFSETHLLFGQDIEFILYEQNNIENIKLVLPKFKECYFDYKFQNFLHIINSPLSEIIKNIQGVANIKSIYSLCNNILAMPKANLFYYEIIKYSLEFLLPDFFYENLRMRLKSFTITEELFERIINIILVSTTHKKLTDLSIIDPAMKEMQNKIDRIKKQGKKSGDKVDFLESYMILTYEFGYKPEEILNMTMFGINQILKYTSNSINYKMSLIAAGNGLSKKVHFITKKGK